MTREQPRWPPRRHEELRLETAHSFGCNVMGWGGVARADFGRPGPKASMWLQLLERTFCSWVANQRRPVCLKMRRGAA
jgi:hypothetical protein